MAEKVRPRGRPRKYDPDEALDRAAELFWIKGYAACSLDELSAVMGMGRPSIAHAFGDKEELFLRALDRYSETVIAQPLQALDGSGPIATRMQGFFAGIVAYTTADPRHPGCLLSSVGAATDSATVHAFLHAKLEELARDVARRLAEAVDAGELPASYSPKDGGRRAVDGLLAIAMRARVGTPRRRLTGDARAAAATVLASSRG